MTQEDLYYRNECPFQGSRSLVPFTHMGIRMMIPAKCSMCKFHEEGECRLLTNPLKRLDYDYCGIEGNTNLVEAKGIRYPVPAKCVECEFFFKHPETQLMIWCEKDKPAEFEMGRGLDYGDRELAQPKAQ